MSGVGFESGSEDYHHPATIAKQESVSSVRDTTEDVVNLELDILHNLRDRLKKAKTNEEAKEALASLNLAITHYEAGRAHRANLQGQREYETYLRDEDRNAIRRSVIFGVITIGCGAITCLLGHPILGAPIITAGLQILKPALARSKQR